MKNADRITNFAIKTITKMCTYYYDRCTNKLRKCIKNGKLAQFSLAYARKLLTCLLERYIT